MVQSQRRTFCAPSSICQAIESSAWCSSPVSFPPSSRASSRSLAARRSRERSPVSVEISASLTEVAAISHSLQLLFGRQSHTHIRVNPSVPAIGFVDPPAVLAPVRGRWSFLLWVNGPLARGVRGRLAGAPRPPEAAGGRPGGLVLRRLGRAGYSPTGR